MTFSCKLKQRTGNCVKCCRKQDKGRVLNNEQYDCARNCLVLKP